MIYVLTTDRYGRDLKIGSFWALWFRKTLKDPETEVITIHNLFGMTGRAMFRLGSVTGSIIHTADETNGLAIDGPAGVTTIDMMPEHTVLFTPGIKTYLDIEWTPTDGKIVQSPTFWFKPLPQVTTP
jgi:hypothetical protein